MTPNITIGVITVSIITLFNSKSKAIRSIFCNIYIIIGLENDFALSIHVISLLKLTPIVIIDVDFQ